MMLCVCFHTVGQHGHSLPCLQLSVSDVEKLCVLLLFHGGKMQRRLDSSVTHLVTVETTGVRVYSSDN